MSDASKATGDAIRAYCRSPSGWHDASAIFAAVFRVVDTTAAVHRYVYECRRRRAGRSEMADDERDEKTMAAGMDVVVAKAKRRYVSYVISRLRIAGVVETKMQGKVRLVRLVNETPA